jgi:hypothetical protein
MYSRTQNENGTYNTRCLYCFMTVASAVETNEDLEHVEAHHICPERALAELLRTRRLSKNRRIAVRHLSYLFVGVSVVVCASGGLVFPAAIFL